MMQYITKEYCDNNRTKGSGTRDYKCRCPSCGGNDLRVTPESSFAYCYECTAGYRIGEPSDKRIQKEYKILPIDDIRIFYENILNFYRESLQRPQREYLNNRGIDDTSIDFFNIGFCSSARIPIYADKLAREAGLSIGNGQPSLSDRIIFPYLAIEHITDLRGRCLNGEDPRYKSPNNSSISRGALYPFNYDVAIERARKTKQLIITEGEIKTIFAHNAGYACVGLPGMTNWRRGCIVDSDINVIVVFDNSSKEEDRVRIDKAIYNLSDHLFNLSVVTLPLLGQHKMDIDTYLLHKDGGERRFKEHIANNMSYEEYKKLRRF